MKPLLAADLNLPWAWRPLKYDDWGTIRDSSGSPVLDGCCGAQYTDLETDEARASKTVPPRVDAICRYTVRAVNAHADLLAALHKVTEMASDMGGKTSAQRCAFIAGIARVAISKATGEGK